jgi:tetratricopeptide (TPR) repeat protein
MDYEAETEATPLTAEQEVELLAIARERASTEVAEATEAKTQDDLFYALPGAAIAAFRLADFDKAKAFAEQALALAPEYRSNWNYGNAIHFAHTVLGLLALESGDIDTAVSQLKQSGETPGSPQLNSFGPTMQLAKALLRRDQFLPVLEYLMQCRIFWEMGSTWLDLWEAKVRAGVMPNFFMNLYR